MGVCVSRAYASLCACICIPPPPAAGRNATAIIMHCTAGGVSLNAIVCQCVGCARIHSGVGNLNRNIIDVTGRVRRYNVVVRRGSGLEQNNGDAPNENKQQNRCDFQNARRGARFFCVCGMSNSIAFVVVVAVVVVDLDAPIRGQAALKRA